MRRIFTLILLFNISIFSVLAQTKPQQPPPVVDIAHADPVTSQPQKLLKSDSIALKLAGRSLERKAVNPDSADLALTSCYFEKDANAMILADRAVMVCGAGNILIARQKRIKIFNDNGKSEATIHINFSNRFGVENLRELRARTINYTNGKIEYTPLDPKMVYREHGEQTGKATDVVTFSFPNVKVGSVLEYEYLWTREYSNNFPKWDFQNSLPTGYSELNVLLNPQLEFSVLFKTSTPFIKDTVSNRGLGHIWALANLPSAKHEPFMRSEVDGLQSLSLVLRSVFVDGKARDMSGTWSLIGKQIAEDKAINKGFNQSLHDEDDLIKAAKEQKTLDERVAYLFNQVKTLMKWNDEKNWFSKDGIKNAWKKKSGNWGEINMILCHLLKEAGVAAYPMLVSTRDNGLLRNDFVDPFQINKLVTYVPIDSTRYYILDATSKYNAYNEIPFDNLNSYGLYLDKEKAKYELVYIKKDAPVKQIVFINAAIKPDGSMEGSAQIGSYSYNKSGSLELFKTLGEKKYEDLLTDNNNNLKISSIKFDNAEVDSLPLTQNIQFKLDLPGTDDKYIYFNPNLFTSLRTNPFISEDRATDVDFGCRFIYAINGRYKIPDGYKVESLPKSINLVMPDKGITFKRIVGEEDGYIIVNYTIDYRKSVYPRTQYPEIYAYFKQMNETLNEQIVLKK